MKAMRIARQLRFLCVHGVLLTFSFLLLSSSAKAQDPGKAIATNHGNSYTLSNRTIEADWTLDGNKLANVAVTDKLHKTTLHLSNPFALLLKDGTIYRVGNLHADGAPQMRPLHPKPDASRFSDRLAGDQFDLPLTSSDGNLHVTSSVVLRDGSHYVRQFVTATAGQRDVPIRRVELIDLQLPGAHVMGSVKGSPIVAGDIFIGFEHPLSDSKVLHDRATATIDRELPLKAGQSVTYSSVIGVTQTGQLRRDFLAYIERERARPYLTFLNYHSWYDLGYFGSYVGCVSLDRISGCGHERHDQRGVTLNSFMFDDGWDDHSSLWSFNKGFPN